MFLLQVHLLGTVNVSRNVTIVLTQQEIGAQIKDSREPPEVHRPLGMRFANEVCSQTVAFCFCTDCKQHWYCLVCLMLRGGFIVAASFK